MSDPVVFRWIRNMKGSAYCERALTAMPNHNAHLTIEEHLLTEQQSALDFDELIREFPKPHG